MHELINDDNKEPIPDGFKLSQNYPNPFNPTTTINYTIPKASNVRIEVFNILGQSVQLLENSFKTAGSYSTTFDAKSLASGIYLYRLTAGNFIEIKKMIVLK